MNQAVLETNEAFYQAFRDCDPVKMEKLWSRENPVSVIHPGWSIITGLEQVIFSWKKILMNSKTINISTTDVQLTILNEGVACVTNNENIDDGVLAATNIYLLEKENWKLIHHQASPIYAEIDDRANGLLH